MITDPAEYLELQELTSRYLYVIDNADWDRLGDVFADHGVFDLTDTWPGQPVPRGLAAIREYLSSLEHPIAHNSFNLIVSEGSGENERRLRSKMLAVLRNGKVIVGEYRDVAERTEQGWRLAERKTVRPSLLRRAAAEGVLFGGEV